MRSLPPEPIGPPELPPLSPDSSPGSPMVAASSPELTEQARILACRLGLAMGELFELQNSGGLLLTPWGVELHQAGPGAPGPVRIDFLRGAMGYRRKHGGGRRQALARAIGLKEGYRPTVIDATAGLGRDAFILAELGCRVRMLERSPIIHALLEDGLQRAATDPACAEIIRTRITLTLGEAVKVLALPPSSPTSPFAATEVIYLDPMFPIREKSALVKKEMRLLRRISGDDADADLLLAAALGRAERRVVVKRPRSAPPIPGPPPSFSLSGKSNRFDIYLISRQS